MFTGIIEEVGRVRQIRPTRLTLAAQKVLEGTKVGDSIAVNGACLTVVEMDKDSFSVDVMPETLRRTNLGDLRPSDVVNLERALALGQRMGGHLVQGHVEGTGKVISRRAEGEAVILRFAAPRELTRYLVPKGFVAVDGVSLTVVDCNATSFSVSLVAYTQEQTNLGRKRSGDKVNLETDIIGRYVEKLRQGAPLSLV